MMQSPTTPTPFDYALYQETVPHRGNAEKLKKQQDILFAWLSGTHLYFTFVFILHKEALLFLSWTNQKAFLSAMCFDMVNCI